MRLWYKYMFLAGLLLGLFSALIRTNNFFKYRINSSPHLIHFIYGYDSLCKLCLCVFESALFYSSANLMIWAKDIEQLKSDLKDNRLWFPYRMEVREYNVKSIFAGTPLEGFEVSELFNRTTMPNYMMVDAARLAIVWKYGGAYSDCDLLHIADWDSSSEPFSFMIQDRFSVSAGKIVNDQSGQVVQGFDWQMLNNAFFVLPKGSKIGWELMRRFIAENEPDYHRKWGFNGPGLFTRVAHDCFYRLGAFASPSLLLDECDQLKLMPWKTVTPMRYDQVENGQYWKPVNESSSQILYQSLKQWHSVLLEIKLPWKDEGDGDRFHSKKSRAPDSTVSRYSLLASLLREHCPISTQGVLINSLT